MKTKARVILGGNCQNRDEDMDTSSFCTSVQSILLLLGLAKLEKLFVHAIEIKTAYLHADVKSDVHARMLKKLIPYPLDLPQLPLRDGTASIKVRKAAYGLAEASHPMVSSLLHQLGYKSSAFDIGVLYRFNKEGPVYILQPFLPPLSLLLLLLPLLLTM